MTLEPIAIRPDAATAVPVAPRGEAEFQLSLPVFEGPLQLLLHLIESRQLDVLSVPLAEVADAYVAHLASHPVNVRHLSEFVAMAAQLILLKSRRLLPAEPLPAVPAGEDEPDEEELRRRLLEYRTLRDAARALGAVDLAAPLYRREPREEDLPAAAVRQLPVSVLLEAIEGLASVAEPPAPPPEVVAREITIGAQIAALRAALGAGRPVVLQAMLAACRSRTEMAVTILAALELVRRREVRVEQSTLFGPIALALAPADERLEPESVE